MILSNSTFSVLTEHGNTIVYSLQPQHLNDIPGTELAERCRLYGHQLAVFHAGQWFKPGMREPITDVRTVALLERVPAA